MLEEMGRLIIEAEIRPRAKGRPIWPGCCAATASSSSTGSALEVSSRRVPSRVRTYRAVEVAPYHNLGRLPEPDFTHKFC